MKSNIASVIKCAVDRQHEIDGIVDHKIDLVVDESPIVIAELEAKITEIARRLHTSKDKVLDWSADVGEALTLMDDTLADNERLQAVLGIAQAHLEVGQNATDNNGYISAALEVLRTIQRGA